jgi:molybdopterin-guanine dinucleotide biosynthesis protein A
VGSEVTESGGGTRTEGRLANVSAALLLGGLSTRMGRDKAHLTLLGVEFATRIARLLDRLYREVLLVGGTPPPDAPGRAVPDLVGVSGPPCALRGLVTALAESGAERVQVVATDLPLVTPDLLVALMAWPESQAVVPRDHLGVHPLCAIYRRESVLGVARGRLAAGEYGLKGLLAELDTDYLEAGDLAAVDPDGVALLNVNTPADLERAEARALEKASDPFWPLPG